MNGMKLEIIMNLSTLQTLCEEVERPVVLFLFGENDAPGFVGHVVVQLC